MMELSKTFTISRHIFKIFNHQRVFQRSCTCQPVCTPVDPNKKGLVLGVFECNDKFVLTPQAEAVNQKSGGKLCEHLNDVSCHLKLGTAFTFTNVDPEYTAITLTSLGPKNPGYNKLEELDESREYVRVGVGAGVRELHNRGCGQILVDDMGAPDAAAEAAELVTWVFQEFKHCAGRKSCANVIPIGESSECWKNGVILAQAQNWARYLSDMPANKMTPMDFAQATLDCLCPLGVVVEARDKDWIKQQNMETFLTVSKGSCEPPMFLECHYTGGKQGESPILICAKGVTFDSGGLCLQKAEGMAEDRGSMAGAAVAVATLKALAELRVPINVVMVIPLCENMVSGQCMKVGDVVRALNGMTIQIEDTDLEGRLIMADALIYGQAVHKPSLVIDIATLTRAVQMATGGGAFGCFCNSDSVWKLVRAAGATTGDRPWRFPLWSYYAKQVTNDPSVDLRNKGAGKAHSCLGAAFLRNFVCGDWVHMDITGVGKLAHSKIQPYLDSSRMTGRPTRTVIQLLDNIAKYCKELSQEQNQNN